MAITLVIPTIQQTTMLDECLSSFFLYHDDSNEIIVVDDGSPLAVQQEVQKICNKHGVEFLSSAFNFGFSATVNRGIDRAKNDIVVLVNNDIIFTEEVASKFEASFDLDEKIGVVGALLFYPNNTIQHGGVMRTDSWFTHRAWHKRVEDCPYVTEESYIIAVTGALFGIRKKMTDQIGIMNPGYFIACEDVELCLRAWKFGWRVFYNGNISAIHAEGATRGNSNEVKAKKGREWMIKEKETNRRFAEDMKKFDFNLIEESIRFANTCLSAKRLQITTALSSGNTGAKECGVIAVNRTGALGDVILATGIIRRLKQKFPAYDIHVSTICDSVFKNNPYVSKVVKDRKQLTGSMVFDLDLVYEKSPKVSVAAAYHRAVFGQSEPIVDLEPELFSTAEDKLSLIRKLPDKFIVHPTAVIHMAVSWPNRTWQRQKWLRVIDNFTSRGAKVIIIGQGNDFKPDAKANVLSMVNKLNIHEIKEIVQMSSVFIGMDSGLLHIAATTTTPLIGLFTCANPVYRLVERKVPSVALIPKVVCRFCLHEQTPPVTFAGCHRGNYQCLNDITVQDVINSANRFLFPG